MLKGKSLTAAYKRNMLAENLLNIYSMLCMTKFNVPQKCARETERFNIPFVAMLG